MVFIFQLVSENIESRSQRYANFGGEEFLHCKIPKTLMGYVKDGRVCVAPLGMLKYSFLRAFSMLESLRPGKI